MNDYPIKNNNFKNLKFNFNYGYDIFSLLGNLVEQRSNVRLPKLYMNRKLKVLTKLWFAFKRV